MSSERKAIRTGVRSLLLNQTEADDRVFQSRVLPHRRHELPVITVYTLEEAVEPESANTGPRELTRDLALVIEAWVEPGEGVDDRMDDLAQEIEDVMHADPYLGGLVGESVLESVDMELLEAGDREMGLVTMTYAITYRTMAPRAPEDLDDLESVQIIYNLGNAVHPGDQAEDMLELVGAES